MKGKQRFIVIGVVVILLLVCIFCIVGTRKQNTQKKTDGVKIKKEIGQEVVFAQILEVNGNEITYAIAEEVENNGTVGGKEKNSEKEGANQSGARPSGRPEMGEMPQGMQPPSGMEMPEGMQPPSGMEMPEGFEGFGGENAPDMSDLGEMPQGFDGGSMPEMGEMPDFSGGMPDRGAMTTDNDTSMFMYNETTYRVSEETVTTYIPVGTDVTTKLGTVTTFSRLAAEDCIALVTEKAKGTTVIVAVYIIA